MRMRQIHPPRPAGGPFSFVYSASPPTTILILKDSNGVRWAVVIDDYGVRRSSSGAVAPESVITLNDPGQTTSWILGVDTSGELLAIPTGYLASYPTSFTMVSSSRNRTWTLKVTNFGAIVAS
jgi:hypothetical protein